MLRFETIRERLRQAAVLGLAVLAGGCSATGLPIEPVTSMQEAKFEGVVRQQHDFSCSAAALATLLNGYFGTRYTERQLLDILRERYDAAAWKAREKTGFSLEDIAFMADKVGYSAEGALIGISGLLQIKGPVIVHLRTGPILHFAVFRGTKDGAILLADPNIGNVRYSPAQFKSKYTGLAMAVWKEGSPLPEAYALLVTDADASGQIQHARKMLDQRPGSLLIRQP